jgi:hypothetical protein
MLAVWRELEKRDRNCGGYFYCVRGWTDDEETNRALALVWLFLMAVSAYACGVEARRPDEVSLIREATTILRETQKAIESGSGDDEMLAWVCFWASVAESRLEDIERWPELVVSRHRTAPKLQAFILVLLSETRYLFTRSLYGVVATIASVLFQHEVSRSLVRRCAVKGQDCGP